MLTTLLAHAGPVPDPSQLWHHWNLDPLLLGGLVALGYVHRRGRRRDPRRPRAGWRDRAFAAALVVLGVALVSPLEAAAGALASAHMVQHVLLVLVAAPLLAVSAPGPTLLRGAPPTVRRLTGRSRRRLRVGHRSARWLRHPAVVWLAYTLTLWLWHAAATYDAAVGRPVVHVLEHVLFTGTALLLWRVVVAAARQAPGSPSPGVGVLLLFGAAMQGVFLSALLTFADHPWYASYAATAPRWGLDPLTDQQLAGLLMWLPGAAVHLGAALVLLAGWLRGSELAGATDLPERAV